MPRMTYTGKHRQVRRGPRVYDLKRGTFDVHPEDVATLSALGATLKDDDSGDAPADDDTTTSAKD